MKRFIAFLVFVLFETTLYLKAQTEVLFFEERIDFSLDSNYFCVNGIYSFQNTKNKDINQQIIFPFAEEATEIDSIRVINMYSGRKIDFKWNGNSIRFAVYLPANDTVDVNIFYRQKTSAKNKYIITSTQLWGKPLDTAVYTLTADKNIKIKTFSYLPDSIREFEDNELYIWEKHNFMPKDDFEIILDK